MTPLQLNQLINLARAGIQQLSTGLKPSDAIELWQTIAAAIVELKQKTLEGADHG